MITQATRYSLIGPIPRAVPLLLMMVIAGSAPVVSGEPAQAPPEWTALNEQVSTVYNHMLVSRRSPKWTPDADRGAMGQIQEAVTDYIASRLNSSPRPSPGNLELEVDAAMVQAFHGKSLAEIRRGNPSISFAHLVANDVTPPNLYVAVFATDPSNKPSNAIRAFTVRDGRFQLIASAGQEFINHTLNVIRLRSFASHELRFLVYGVYIGSPEGLTKLTAYNFDGTTIETLWNEESVQNADVSFVNDQIVVDSYDQGVPKHPAPWPSTRKYYAQTPDGLQLVKVEHGEVR